MDDFRNRLVNIRRQNGLTQKELAESIGASERGIQNYEIGYRKPTFELLIAIADFFSVSIDYLVGRTDNPNINH